MKTNKQPDPEKAIRCGCGLILRQKKWMDHWRTCPVGSARDATQEEIQMLEAQEARLKKEADEHAEWLVEDRRNRQNKESL